MTAFIKNIRKEGVWKKKLLFYFKYDTALLFNFII